MLARQAAIAVFFLALLAVGNGSVFEQNSAIRTLKQFSFPGTYLSALTQYSMHVATIGRCFQPFYAGTATHGVA